MELERSGEDHAACTKCRICYKGYEYEHSWKNDNPPAFWGIKGGWEDGHFKHPAPVPCRLMDHVCDLPDCGNPGTMRCGGCKQFWYCSQQVPCIP